MSDKCSSLSLKMVGLVLAQNALMAGLLFYDVADVIPIELLGRGALLVAATLVTILLAKKWLDPVRNISAKLTDIEAGKPVLADDDGMRGDEIGLISRQLERLSHNHLTRFLEDNQERDIRETAAVETSTRVLVAAQSEAQMLKTVVEALDGGLRRLAVGDLTVRLDMPFPEEFEGSRADFNHALANLEETLGRIGSGAHGLHTTCIDIKDGIVEAAHAGARQTAAIARLAVEMSTLAETLRARRMQTRHTADIGYNAKIDMHRPKEAMQATAMAMEAARKASEAIEPAAAVIQDIAFQANMLALNAGIEAAQSGESSGSFKAVAAEIRNLAERAAHAAREITTLSRQTAQAAELGGKSVEKAEGELKAMAIYLDALQGHVQSIAENSESEIESVASVRMVVMAIAKTSRDHTGALDALAARVGGVAREIGAIDHHAGRFTPVTILTEGGVSIPEMMKPGKPGSHLRLVKS